MIKSKVERVPAYAPPTKVVKVAPPTYVAPPKPALEVAPELAAYIAPVEVKLSTPKPSYKSTTPDWLTAWMGGLSTVPAPTLNAIKEVDPPKNTDKSGTYYSGYSRSWKRPVKPKPEPAPYTPYKPAVPEPKKYVQPTLNYERKEATVEKPTRREYRRLNRSGYSNTPNDNYLTSY